MHEHLDISFSSYELTALPTRQKSAPSTRSHMQVMSFILTRGFLQALLYVITRTLLKHLRSAGVVLVGCIVAL